MRIAHCCAVERENGPGGERNSAARVGSEECTYLRKIKMRQSSTSSHEASETAARQRAIQAKTDARDAQKKGTGSEQDQAPQTGARPYPVPPFPPQHQAKPGTEAILDPRPMYDAPHYLGSRKLEDKIAIITGGDSGIGRAVAILYAREGADVAVVYLNEHGDAKETKAAVEKEGRRCILFSGDVADAAFCREAVETTVRELGGLDILVNNAAFQEHSADI